MPLKNKEIKVLFVSRWYPNRIDAMEGLFVRKHALAVSLYNEVQVLFVKEDKAVTHREVVVAEVDNIKETIVYYPFSKIRALRAIRYFTALFYGYRQVLSQGFSPQILHVNVLTRVGFFAYLLKLFTHKPYLVSEHWSRYLPHGYYATTTALHKWLTRLVVKNAAYFIPVSNVLKSALDSFCLKNPNCRIVHNTIEDFFFEHSTREKRNVKRLLHISCFDEKAKNVKGIIRAFGNLYQKRQDVELVIVGTGQDFNSIKFFVEEEYDKIPIALVGEQTPDEVAAWLYSSDVFVLFSNYETSGVVLMESLASGTPVISTPCGIAPEIITKDNGAIVPFADEQALTEKMEWMINHQSNFDKDKISRSAEQFRFRSVGEQLSDIYTTIIEGRNKETPVASV